MRTGGNVDAQNESIGPRALFGCPVVIVNETEVAPGIRIAKFPGNWTRLRNMKEVQMTRYNHMTHGTLKTGAGLREYYIGIQNDEVAMPISEARTLANDILRNVADAERENKRDIAAQKKAVKAAVKKVRTRKPRGK